MVLLNPSRVAAEAVDALLTEARLTPKPGLVDAAGSGAHNDMDLALLEASAESLRDAFEQCALWGHAAGPLNRLVQIGVDGERRMREATGGVNTHKGALYSLGLACAAVGAVGDGRGAVIDTCRLWATQLRDQWWRQVEQGRDQPSASDLAVQRLGIRGIREEAADGFRTVRHVGLPALESGADDAPLRALLALMAHNDDTNLIARGGLLALRTVQAWALGLLERGLTSAELREELARADAWFTHRRWSPGGSADQLALSLFLACTTTPDEG